MFDYTIPGGLPAGSRGVWSHLPLQPLAEGVLTPFSYSMLAEIMGRAWYKYYDALDFDPMPRARIMRYLNGLPYLSLTLSAQREAEQAAIEPITLRINGQSFPITKWEKPGFLAAIKFGLKERKIAPLLEKLEQGLDANGAKLSAWYDKVKEYRWTQAEILLVMEEIEPLGSEPMIAWFAARHQLDRLINRLLQASQNKTDVAATVRQIEAMFGADSQSKQLADAPHRAHNEAELRNLRWEEAPDSPTHVGKNSSTTNDQPLLDLLETGQRKAAQEWIQQARRMMLLQNRAQHAFAYVLAATRRWALAAEREAMADKRIAESGDVFFFELEEVKQMMTGEWNISSTRAIQATAQKRKAEYERWHGLDAAELLIGDTVAKRSA